MQTYLQNNVNYLTPFGSPIAARAYASGEYRYGFNGMEKDDEVKGAGIHYNSDFRQYDSRIGRWFSIDPLFEQFVELTPYSNCFNNPIVFFDKGGDIGIFGAIAGAGWELVGQVTANMVTGKPLNDIDWVDVGVAAVFGAVGIPPGVNKLSKIGKSVYKVGMNVVESGIQANYNWSTREGYSSVTSGSKPLSQGLTEFAVSFSVGQFVGAGKTYKRAVKNVDVKITSQKAHTAAMKSKKVTQQNSLANTQAKKQNVAQQEKVIKKSANLSNTKQAVIESKVAEKVLDLEKNIVTRTNSGIGTSAATAISKTLYPPGYTGNSYIYSPEKMGNTTYYYMDKDHTTVYDASTRMMYTLKDKKLSDGRREYVDPTKKVLISANKK